MRVCVTVRKVWTKTASVDNGTQSTTQWIAINSSHTNAHTQIPESKDEKERHSDGISQSARVHRAYNGASQWAVRGWWDISESPCQDLHCVLTNLHPPSFDLFLSGPTSFFPGWIPRWLKVVRRGDGAQSTSHSPVYESLHCGCALFLTLFVASFFPFLALLKWA